MERIWKMFGEEEGKNMIKVYCKELSVYNEIIIKYYLL